MQKQPFTEVLQNKCSYAFPDIHKKISVLNFLLNTVRDLKACNFIKKETPTQAFRVNITKFSRIAF